jgi:hypothetical protein
MTKYPYEVTGHNKYKRLFLRNDLYCYETTASKVRTYVPLEPQPTVECLVCVYRYYATQKREKGNNDFKKRMSWIEGGRLALTEYPGDSRPVLPHGNSKASSEPYVRTPHATLEKVKEQLNVPSGKVVYDKLVDELDIDEAPRNSRVVNNKQANERKKERDNTSKTCRLNFADEVQSSCSVF